jgi:hypothetical protein
MTIDKWLSEKKQKIPEEEQTIDYSTDLAAQQIHELKKKILGNIVNKNEKELSNKSNASVKKDYFLEKVLEFQTWLNARTYLKGDTSKIKIWISNLYRIIGEQQKEIKEQQSTENKEQLLERFRRIPPRFLDDKTRIAVNKKLRGMELTSSDTYYLRKLRKQIEKKLKDLKNYQILRDLLEL